MGVKEKVIEQLKQIYDPEIPVDIYELGLIYSIVVKNSAHTGLFDVNIEMTLTSPGCAVAESLVGQVYNIASILEEINELQVEIVFEPPWNPALMSQNAKDVLDSFF